MAVGGWLRESREPKERLNKSKQEVVAHKTSNGRERPSRTARAQLPGLNWQEPNAHSGLALPAAVLSALGSHGQKQAALGLCVSGT